MRRKLRLAGKAVLVSGLLVWFGVQVRGGKGARTQGLATLFYVGTPSRGQCSMRICTSRYYCILKKFSVPKLSTVLFY